MTVPDCSRTHSTPRSSNLAGSIEGREVDDLFSNRVADWIADREGWDAQARHRWRALRVDVRARAGDGAELRLTGEPEGPTGILLVRGGAGPWVN